MPTSSLSSLSDAFTQTFRNTCVRIHPKIITSSFITIIVRKEIDRKKKKFIRGSYALYLSLSAWRSVCESCCQLFFRSLICDMPSTSQLCTVEVLLFQPRNAAFLFQMKIDLFFILISNNLLFCCRSHFSLSLPVCLILKTKENHISSANITIHNFFSSDDHR